MWAKVAELAVICEEFEKNMQIRWRYVVNDEEKCH